MRLSRACLALLSLFGPPQAALAQKAAAGRSAGACEGSRSQDVLRTVSPKGEIVLESGRAVRLADLRLPEGEDAERPFGWLRSLAGNTVEVTLVENRPDRWNRWVADIAVTGGPAPIDIGERLVAEGFAMVDAGERDRLCRPSLLAHEEAARRRGVGLWANERYKPVAAEDASRFGERVGRFALVEGLVRSVGERGPRTYLNFGPDWTTDLTITIPKRTWRILVEQGVSAASLRGRRIRARGLIEDWRGPAIEIVAPEMLEVLGKDPPKDLRRH